MPRLVGDDPCAVCPHHGDSTCLRANVDVCLIVDDDDGGAAFQHLLMAGVASEAPRAAPRDDPEFGRARLCRVEVQEARAHVLSSCDGY